MAESAHCYTPSWCKCPDEPKCQLCKQGRCPVDSVHPDRLSDSVVSAASKRPPLDHPALATGVCVRCGFDVYGYFADDEADDALIDRHADALAALAGMYRQVFIR